MGAFSAFAENELLDHILGTGSYSRPTNLYLALCTADPTDTGTGTSITEPSGGSYARVVCDSWDSGSSRATANSAAITFAKATGNWGVITHFAICDAATVGNMIAYGEVTPNKNILSGDTASVSIGDLDISFDSGGMSDYSANAMLDHVFEGTAFTPPTSIFAALVTGTIVDSDTGTTMSEASGGNYARIEHNDFNVATLGATANASTLTFLTASVTLGTITDVALCDALVTGNLLFYSGVNTSKPIDKSDTPIFYTDELDLTLE